MIHGEAGTPVAAAAATSRAADASESDTAYEASDAASAAASDAADASAAPSEEQKGYRCEPEWLAGLSQPYRDLVWVAGRVVRSTQALRVALADSSTVLRVSVSGKGATLNVAAIAPAALGALELEAPPPGYVTTLLYPPAGCGATPRTCNINERFLCIARQPPFGQFQCGRAFPPEEPSGGPGNDTLGAELVDHFLRQTGRCCWETDAAAPLAGSPDRCGDSSRCARHPRFYVCGDRCGELEPTRAYMCRKHATAFRDARLRRQHVLNWFVRRASPGPRRSGDWLGVCCWCLADSSNTVCDCGGSVASLFGVRP